MPGTEAFASSPGWFAAAPDFAALLVPTMSVPSPLQLPWPVYGGACGGEGG